jgi:hypothetical protein
MSDDRSHEAAPRPNLRASDEDREELINELNDHAVAGRLTTDELEQRLTAAYAARTTAELAALRRDLPVSARQSALSHAARRSQLTRRLIQETGGALGLFIVSTVIWLVSGGNGQFWPVWILLVVVLSAVRNGWALFGPAADLDTVELDLTNRHARRTNRQAERDQRRRGKT